MPLGPYVERQRATSPSEQSRSTWNWTTMTAASAARGPGRVRTSPASSPTGIISQVIVSADSRVAMSRRVR
jgi:hypothetical protein